MSNPIFPVVGVNWFEVEAYCHWGNTTGDVLPLESEQKLGIPEGYAVRLPTEEEWERAARGSHGWEYPWGRKFKADFANARGEEEPGRIGSTAVCTYPQGISPAGAWDMAGNVWEWTGSLWLPGEKRRVLRGGSWIHNRWDARCAFRYGDLPGYFDYFVGFRVVVSLADSGF